LLLCATAALAGCAGGPKAQAPPGANLAGSWKLNHTLSDDPQRVIARMRAEANRLIERQMAAMGEEPLPRGGARGQGGAAGGTAGGTAGGGAGAGPVPGADEPAGAPPGGHGMHRPDPLKRSPMMHLLSTALARGDFLTVRQSSEEFVLDYGTTVRRFTPGTHSVVSAEMGVADQTSGWEGREYVINIKAQVGPNAVEHYGLSSDGQHLVQKLHIGAAELPAVDLTRVYDRTTDEAPRSLPTND
jgi:hypothetical protein